MKSPSRKSRIIGCVAIGLLMIGSAAYAGNVSKTRHPNLAAAQTLIERAVNRVTMAQKANEYDMDGHAAKAKELLDQAYAEIKLAAEATNEKKK